MRKKTKLWENGTPYFEPSYGQEEPALVHYTDLGRYAREGVERPGCVIVFPGGGYGCRADYEGEPVAEMFNTAGIKSFVLEYRLSPYHYPAITDDAHRAVRWVRYHADELGVDPDKIAVLGFSAGGHLASTALTLWDRGLDTGDEIDRVSSRPDAGILCYAVISFEDRWTHDGTKKAMLREAEDPETLSRMMTGYFNVNDETPPMFLWHTAGDNCVPSQNSLLMAKELADRRIPYELHVFTEGNHGIGLATGMAGNEKWGELASIWLQKLGF